MRSLVSLHNEEMPLSLQVCTINIEYLNYQGILFRTVFDKEMTYLK